MEPNFRITSLVAFAILFVLTGCNVVFSKDCNVTRRLAAELFKRPGGGDNSTKADDSQFICLANTTCCSKVMERKLLLLSEEIRLQMVSSLHGNISESFLNASQNFKGFYKSLIETSYKNLDTLYSRTYSDRYKNHKVIFRHLFTKLVDYMTGKEEMDLKQTIDNWFSTLYQKVYMISNPGFHFDAVYQHCLLETADVLMPFGDIPRKISLQVKKSFLASKVLQDALTVGSRVVDELLNMRSNVKCAQAFMKMTQCPMCSGIAEKVKPCYNYCMNVMKGCTAYPAVVGPAWNAYVTALHKLAIKADGPFSMEAIIDPLGVKISEGIMFFQFNRQNITTHVMKKCGNPPPSELKSLTKRDLSDGMAYPYKFDSGNDALRPTTAYGTSLYRLITNLKKVLAQFKDHWVSLPGNACSSGFAAADNDMGNCWNGKAVDSYKKPVVKDGVDGMFKNPEVSLDKKDPHLTVTRQVIKLKEITQRILSAVNGADSNQIDLEESSGEGSGYGSGSGSGGGDGSGVKPTAWTRTQPATYTDVINTIEDKKTPPSSPTPTMGNTIDENDKKQDENSSENSADISKSVGGKYPGSTSSLVTGRHSFSVLCSIVGFFTFYLLFQ